MANQASFEPLDHYSWLKWLNICAGLISTATLDGGIGLLLPMQEKTYRRLLMLQNALNTMLPHHAGLNPKAFRLVWFYNQNLVLASALPCQPMASFPQTLSPGQLLLLDFCSPTTQLQSQKLSLWCFHSVILKVPCVRPLRLPDVSQDDARRQAEFAERRAEHPGRGAAQQVPAPQHHGAQRPGQEDRHHAGHRKCTERLWGVRSLVWVDRRSCSEVHVSSLRGGFVWSTTFSGCFHQILEDLLEIDRVTAHFWEPHSCKTPALNAVFTLSPEDVSVCANLVVFGRWKWLQSCFLGIFCTKKETSKNNLHQICVQVLVFICLFTKMSCLYLRVKQKVV